TTPGATPPLQTNPEAGRPVDPLAPPSPDPIRPDATAAPHHGDATFVAHNPDATAVTIDNDPTSHAVPETLGRPEDKREKSPVELFHELTPDQKQVVLDRTSKMDPKEVAKTMAEEGFTTSEARNYLKALYKDKSEAEMAEILQGGGFDSPKAKEARESEQDVDY